MNSKKIKVNDTLVLEELRAVEDPWVRLNVLTAIGNATDNDEAVKKLMEETATSPLISGIIDECKSWPGYPLKSHKDAKHIVQKIGFLADIGMNKNISDISFIAKKLLEHQTVDGGFQTLILIPKVFGGNDKPEWNWILCDLPLVVHALYAFGFYNDERVIKATEFLASLVQENGWRCTASIPKFKGPGKKEDPCPFANLIILKTLSLSRKLRDSKSCKNGTEMLLNHWQARKNKKYFLFAMGTKFMKLKYPFVWYDILHVVDTLSRFNWVHGDRRFQEMCEIIFSKADHNGWYTPESVWMAYKGFDFTQKKQPSSMLTLAIMRIKKRLGLL